MSVSDLQEKISTLVSPLNGRVEAAADLTELIRRDALPQAPIAAFVLPLGLTGRTDGDAGAGYFTQMVDEVFGVILVVRAAGDVTGGKALPTIDVLVWDIINHVCGTDLGDDDDDAIGVYRLQRGRLIDLKAGTIFYQLDFALQRQIQVP